MKHPADLTNDSLVKKVTTSVFLNAVSEFSLPQEQRELQRAIHRELALPCEQALSAFERDCTERLEEAERESRQERDRIQGVERQAERDHSETETAAKDIRSSLSHLYTDACGNVSKFSLKTELTPTWLKSTAFERKPLDGSAFQAPTLRQQALNELNDARSTWSAISAIAASARFYRPNSDFLTLLFIGLSVGFGVFFAILVQNWFAFSVAGILLYGLFLFTWRTSKQAQLKELFSKLVTAGGRCVSYLNEFVTGAELTRRDAEVHCHASLKQARDRHSARLAQIEQMRSQDFLALKDKFSQLATRLHENVSTFTQKAAFASYDWELPVWQTWAPDPSPEFAARVGILAYSSSDLKNKLPEVDWTFTLPALVPFADGRALLFNANGKAKDLASSALQSVILRVLANTPPGKARFTLIDPIGLGHNVADLMPLGDYDPELIGGRAWTEPQHIEQQLTKITEEMETVIQTYLRKQYASIQEYNADHREVAHPFRFLVLFDFPVNFSESAARRLTSIVKNGARCGVFTLMLRDTAKALPYHYDAKELEENATVLNFDENSFPQAFEWRDFDLEGFKFQLDDQPPQDISRTIIEKSGQMAAQGMKKEVPFEKLLAAMQPDSWRVSSTAEHLKAAIGPAGKGRPQELALGSGQEAHALLVGRTGSGKTNLMHVIITSLALKYSPAELQLYLVDFKGGVGFKRYAEFRLPHAKVIAIESEREFGLSVLRGLDTELKRRSETFRAAGVDNLAAYRARANGAATLPRILLVVDEFQELFVENDDLAQQAKIVFDRLARQGRSFGIHFLLATQSLAGSAQLPAGIMGQIKVRIALACTETDSRLILADDNKAARALSRPGEAIYNPMGGLIEGNTPFQVALFNEERDLSKYLNMVTDMARDHQCSAVPIIFEGNELARTEDCEPLNQLLAEKDWVQSKGIDIFLGEPIAIQPPVAGRLRRQSGSNLVIVTREEGEGVGMCIATLLSIFAQQRPGTARIHIADFTTPDSEWAEHAEEIAASFPGNIKVIGRQREVGSMLATIAAEVRSRGDNPTNNDAIFLVLQGLHRIKALREDIDDDDGNNAVEILRQILREGPELGVHVITWTDTVPSVARGLGRKALNEFGLRVGAVMSGEDSMNLFDSMAASKIIKTHRALFVDEDRPGQLVPFRPYAMPSAAWLKEAGQRLRTRISNTTV